MAIKHKDLLAIVTKLKGDYEPWGSTPRETLTQWFPDCSCGCKYFAPIEGQLGADWGICCNRKSHRAGLLTFEHQGCKEFKGEEE